MTKLDHFCILLLQLEVKIKSWGRPGGLQYEMGHITRFDPPLGDFTRVQALEQKFVENLTFFIIFEHVFVAITVLCMVSVRRQQYFFLLQLQ